MVGGDLRFEEGVHLIRPVDFHMSDIWVFSGEFHGKVFERVVLRHGDEGNWYTDGDAGFAVDE
jgi:hypothetical protein